MGISRHEKRRRKDVVRRYKERYHIKMVFPDIGPRTRRREDRESALKYAGRIAEGGLFTLSSFSGGGAKLRVPSAVHVVDSYTDEILWFWSAGW